MSFAQRVMSDTWTRIKLKDARRTASLCNLCVSVVSEFPAKVNHRDTENASEVAQRNQNGSRTVAYCVF
jgi:hypothetical protein